MHNKYKTALLELGSAVLLQNGRKRISCRGAERLYVENFVEAGADVWYNFTWKVCSNGE